MDRILIIDDSVVQANMLTAILEEDYAITQAHTAEDGLNWARGGDFSLILLDVVMPEMDGFGLLRKLQEEVVTQHTPVILITSLRDVEHEEWGLTLGAVDEIHLAGGLLDHGEKYHPVTSVTWAPARLPEEVTARIKETAVAVYRALDCAGFARVDLFLTGDGELVFNEVNTIPGFTAHSRYPGMMKAAGIDFPQLLDRIIRQAVEA